MVFYKIELTFFSRTTEKKDTEDNICRLKFFHLLAQINQN